MDEIEPHAKLLGDFDEYATVLHYYTRALLTYDPPRAVKIAQQSLQMMEEKYGPVARETITARYYCAIALFEHGSLEEGAEMMEKNQAAQDRFKGPDHPDAIANRTEALRMREVVERTKRGG